MTSKRELPPLFEPGKGIVLIGAGDLSKQAAGLVFGRVWLGSSSVSCGDSRRSASGRVFNAHAGHKVTVELCEAFTARRGEELRLVGGVDRRYLCDRKISIVENQYVGRNVFTAATLIEARARWVMAMEHHGFGEPLLVAPQSWQAAMLGSGNAPSDVRKARSKTAAAELALMLGRIEPFTEDEADAFNIWWWYLRHFIDLPLPAVASVKWTKPGATSAAPRPRRPRVKKSEASPV